MSYLEKMQEKEKPNYLDLMQKSTKPNYFQSMQETITHRSFWDKIKDLGTAAKETIQEATNKRIESIKAYPAALKKHLQETPTPQPTKWMGMDITNITGMPSDIEKYGLPGSSQRKEAEQKFGESITPSPLPIETYAAGRLLKESGIPISEKDLQAYKQKYNITSKDISETPIKIAGGVEKLLAAKMALSVIPVPTAVQTGINLLSKTHPKIALTLASSFKEGATFATSEVFNQVSKIASGDEKITSKIITDPMKKGVMGMTIGAIWGIKNIPTKTILSGLDATTWSLLEKKFQGKKISPEMVNEALIAGGIAAGFTGTVSGVSNIVRNNRTREYERLLNENYQPQEAEYLRTLGKETVTEFKTAISAGNQLKIDKILKEIETRKPESLDFFNNLLVKQQVLNIVKQDPKFVDVSTALVVKQLPDYLSKLEPDAQNIIVKALPNIMSTEQVGIKEATNIAAKLLKIDIPATPIHEAVLPQNIKGVQDQVPITPIKPMQESFTEQLIQNEKGTINTEGVANLMDKAKNLPIEDTVQGLKKIIQITAGNTEEFLQGIMGKTKGREARELLRELDSRTTTMISAIRERNAGLLKQIPKEARNYLSDVLKGISGKDEQGNLVFGAMRRAGIIDPTTAKAGDILPDGRVVGNLDPTEKGLITYRKFDTKQEYQELISKYPKTKDIINKYLATEEAVTKTAMGNVIPKFANDLFRQQYDIQKMSDEGGVYVPSVREDQRFFARLKNLFQFNQSPGKLFKTGSLAEQGLEEKDFLKSYTKRQEEFAVAAIKNNIGAKLLAMSITPIKGVKPDLGYTQIDLNSPKIKKLIETNKDLFTSMGINPSPPSLKELSAMGELGLKFPEMRQFEAFLRKNKVKLDSLSNYQIPTLLLKKFGLKENKPFFNDPRAEQVAQGIKKLSNQFLNYVTSNYLTKLSTSVRNAGAGEIQNLLKLTTNLFEGDLIAVKENLKSHITSLTPQVIENLPSGLIGAGTPAPLEKMIDPVKYALAHPIKTTLIPFEKVESYFKRVIFQGDLNTAAIKSFNDKIKIGEIKPAQREAYLKDFKENYTTDLFQTIRDDVDLYALNYKNVPWFIENLPKGFAYFLSYPYQMTRTLLAHSPLALIGATKENFNTRRARVVALTTLLAAAWGVSDSSIKERKKQQQRLALKKIDVNFDTTGRLKFYADEETERWLRVYDFPILGDALYFREVMNDNADMGDWISSKISPGAYFTFPALLFGLRSKYNATKPISSLIGQEVAGYLPLAGYLKYARILSDPKIRQIFSQDYNAFENFINPIRDVIPGASQGLEPKIAKIGVEKGQQKMYDIPAETMKLLFLNIKSIDKKEYLQYEIDEYAKGNVMRRIKKQVKKEMKKSNTY